MEIDDADDQMAQKIQKGEDVPTRAKQQLEKAQAALRAQKAKAKQTKRMQMSTALSYGVSSGRAAHILDRQTPHRVSKTTKRARTDTSEQRSERQPASASRFHFVDRSEKVLRKGGKQSRHAFKSKKKYVTCDGCKVMVSYARRYKRR